jgi:NTP pyrophosphatase (non-canonical NTP hydrolase)
MNVHTITDLIAQVSDTYARKFGISRDPDWYLFKLQEELGELTQCYLMLTGRGRSKGKNAQQLRDDFEKEFADVFCHVLLFAKAHDIDLEKNIHDKWLQYIQRQTESEEKAEEQG